jgi:uncharacterized LabA/DUF88 family protein
MTAAPPKPPPAERVIAYVDGFNLYFGLHDAGWRHCYWLNMAALASNLLKPNQTLVRTKYFTSRLSGPSPGSSSAFSSKLNSKRKRQSDFLDALSTIPSLDIQYGKYLSKPARCFACGSSWTTFEEKMTDVNLATALLTDAFQDNFDTALLISADSDLVPPVQSVRSIFPSKRVVIAFPPLRSSVDLKRVANAWLNIHESTLKHSLLSDPVVTPSGFAIRRPAHWS